MNLEDENELLFETTDDEGDSLLEYIKEFEHENSNTTTSVDAETKTDDSSIELPKSTTQQNSLAHRLIVCANKAGISSSTSERDRISAVIYEASKGSKFFENEQRKDAELTQKIQNLLEKAERTSKQDLTIDEREITRKLEKLDSERDLENYIIHVDMDAFYASVEELDRPELKTKPMAVGGMGMLTTANYEARKFGVRSAMPGFIAKKLCPELILIKPNFKKYQDVSVIIRDVYAIYDPNFSSMSLDEAYLNITDYLHENPEKTPSAVAEELRNEIFARTKLTASAGIAANKMLAKICTDINKPNGQLQLPNDREKIAEFLSKTKVRKIPGVGRVTERLLTSLKIETCDDLRNNLVLLSKLLTPKIFEFLMRASIGIASTEVSDEYDRKSMGVERTFATLSTLNAQLVKLEEIAEKLAQDLEKSSLKGRTITLKLKTSNFIVRTRAKTASSPVFTAEDLFKIGSQLLRSENESIGPFDLRLMGLRVTQLQSKDDLGIEKYFATNQTADENEKNNDTHAPTLDFVCPICNYHSTTYTEKEGTIHISNCLKNQERAPNSGANAKTKQKSTITRKLPDSKKRKLNQTNDLRTFFNNPQPKTEEVSCPVCNKTLKELRIQSFAINKHIDECLQN
ncbi:hypothetical protein HK098_004948 [Nowakowskiella sp. JEL0407]|nr:hypothetical protein HK098_004948 [Nowakowskiella sp. JEL0407]